VFGVFLSYTGNTKGVFGVFVSAGVKVFLRQGCFAGCFVFEANQLQKTREKGVFRPEIS